MEWKKRWVAVVVIVLVMVGAMQAAAIRPSVVNGQAGGDGSDAPYLYYFSNDLNAWVIERADGKDRRLLGQGLMTDGLNKPYGPGWSPSGKWFAWLGTKYSGLGPEPTPRAWVISADGQTVAGEFADVAEMYWSPTEDLLFLAQTNGLFYYHGEMTYIRYSLFDPRTGTIIDSISTVTSYEEHWPRLVWTPDGEYAIARASNYGSDRTRYYVFDDTGFQHMALVPTIIDRPPSALGYVAYWTERSFKIENILTGEHQALTSDVMPIPEDVLYTNQNSGQWSTTGQYAVYVLREGENYVVWLLDLAKVKWELLTTCFLPIYSIYNDMILPQFSSDDHYIAYLEYADCVDGPNERIQIIEPVILDLFTGTSHTVPIMSLTTEPSTDLFWIDETSLILSALLTDAALDDIKQVNVEIEVTTESVSYFELPIAYFSVSHFSPDGRYVASVWDGPVVLELETSQKQGFRPDSRGWFSESGGQIIWHRSSEWLLIGDYALVAGGGTGGVWVSVMQPDGSGRRELNYCSTLGHCVNWLPSQVNPLDLPAPLPDKQRFPAQILHGNQWIWYLDWSPDGQQLATGTSGWYDLDDMQIWSLTKREIITEFPELYRTVGSSAGVDWQLSTSGDYNALLIERSDSSIDDFPSSYAISPGGQYAIVSTDDVGPAIVDVQSQRVLFAVSEPYDRVWSASFSPDGRLVAVAYMDRPGVIYDIQTQAIVGYLPNTGFAVAFSPDGEYLAVGVSWDVEIWRVSDLIGERE
ncbi:MAG: hypothetical protein BroJett018_49120 [Chloroflexota bacterium]|nr:MAG: hypothetical protein BroJett018_49120 [Chloroflexota bacterium]